MRCFVILICLPHLILIVDFFYRQQIVAGKDQKQENNNYINAGKDCTWGFTVACH